MKNLKKILILILILAILISGIFEIYSLILKRLYPRDFSEYVYKYSEKYEVDHNWIFALIKTESNFKEESVSGSGAIGLMQLMEKTAEEVAEKIGLENINLKDPETNIEIGTKYFKNLLDYYNGNYYLAISAYNAGIGTVAKWINDGIINEDGTDIENIPYKETNNYIRKMLKNYKIYKEIY